MKIHHKAERPLLYLSGPLAVGEDKLRDMGCRYRCFSYAYVCKGAFFYSKTYRKQLDRCLELGTGVMMDSSAFSFHEFVRKRSGKYAGADLEKMREDTIERYVDFAKRDGKKWDFYVTFDYVKHCPTIYEMTKRLEKEGIRPVPVYHGDHGTEWIERYCKEGYKLIGIGSLIRSYKNKKRYYDKCFNIAEKYGVLLHGLGQTALSHMFMFPWYSLDSATWAKFAAYGFIIYPDLNRNTIGAYHVTGRKLGSTELHNLSKDMQKAIARSVEECGFDLDVLKTDGRQRALYNVYVFCNKLHQLKEIVSQTKAKWSVLS